jgi:hypothetical protein
MSTTKTGRVALNAISRRLPSAVSSSTLVLSIPLDLPLLPTLTS